MNQYTKIDGTIIEYEDIPESPYSYIWVNLPNSELQYSSGNGEGMFAYCLEKDFKDYTENKESGEFLCKIANNSIYYPQIVAGTIILAEHRGEDRAMAVYSELPNALNNWKE